MQVLKSHKILVLVSLLLVIVLAVSIVVFVENFPKPSSNPSPSLTPSPSPFPTGNTPTPSTTSAATSTPTTTFTPPSTTQPSLTLGLLPGEVGAYQGQSLTPVSVYIQYLIAHPDVAIAGTQSINRETYRLAITGMVNNPLNYTYDSVVTSFNSTLQVGTLPCVEGWSVTLLWQGVPITDLLQQAGVSPNANTLIFLASDGYSSSLPLQYVTQNNIMIAYKMNNLTLTDRTGWPLFLVAQNQYGYKWVEWLTEINVSNDSNYLGYWESRGYPNNATVLGVQSTAPFNIDPVVLSVATILIVAVIVAVAVFFSRHRMLRKKEVFSQPSSMYNFVQISLK
jgi:DMSO/TMAO reductase YedYZ molybdopterin-dependent catalytic subunit